MNKTYREDVVQAAIRGLKEGGMKEANIFEFLLVRVYECGYNECLRNLQEKHSHQYSDIVSDGGLDPRN
jgi:hypothetical protein